MTVKNRSFNKPLIISNCFGGGRWIVSFLDFRIRHKKCHRGKTLRCIYNLLLNVTRSSAKYSKLKKLYRK